MEPDTQEQFLREARTIARLQHLHIVRVHDFGFQDETPYLVMEYTPNGTLRARHPKGTRLSLEQIISYVKQIAPALDYAHPQRVIHRDIKPENLLLNATDEVVLSDFGISECWSTSGCAATHPFTERSLRCSVSICMNRLPVYVIGFPPFLRRSRMPSSECWPKSRKRGLSVCKISQRCLKLFMMPPNLSH